MHDFVCALQQWGLCFPVMWESCNQSLLAFTVRFPGDSQSLCQLPRLGRLTWGLEPSQEWEIVFDVIVLQFVGHHLTDMGFDFIMFVPLLPSCCSFFFFGREMSFLVGSIVLLSMLVAILVLLQEEMSTCPSTLPS